MRLLWGGKQGRGWEFGDDGDEKHKGKLHPIR